MADPTVTTQTRKLWRTRTDLARPKANRDHLQKARTPLRQISLQTRLQQKTQPVHQGKYIKDLALSRVPSWTPVIQKPPPSYQHFDLPASPQPELHRKTILDQTPVSLSAQQEHGSSHRWNHLGMAPCDWKVTHQKDQYRAWRRKQTQEVLILLRQLGPVLRSRRHLPGVQHENGRTQALSRTVSQIQRNPDEKANKRIKPDQPTDTKETQNNQKEKQPQHHRVRVQCRRIKWLPFRIRRQWVRNCKRRQKIASRLIDWLSLK